MGQSNYNTFLDNAAVPPKEEKLRLARKRLWRGFLGTTWIGAFAFGLFMLTFYVRSIVLNKMYAWDMVNPGMYHSDRWDSNFGFGLHLIGGTYLMLLGPLQFVPAIRHKWIHFHRWNGRLTAASAILTAVGALYYVWAVGSTTKDLDIGGGKVEWSNWFFGLVTLTCGFQIVRHAAFTKKIQLHKLWAYRLAGCAIGNIFARLYLLVCFMIFFDQNNIDGQAFKIAIFVLQVIFIAPFILIADEIWRREQQEDSTPTKCFLVAVSFVLTVSTLLLLLQILLAWVPFMGTDLDDADENEL